MRYRLLPALLIRRRDPGVRPAVAKRAGALARGLPQGHFSGDRDREQYCDVRQQTIPTRSRPRSMAARMVASRVIGSDRNDILIVSIQAQAE
jgi:hypothetical protein